MAPRVELPQQGLLDGVVAWWKESRFSQPFVRLTTVAEIPGLAPVFRNELKERLLQETVLSSPPCGHRIHQCQDNIQPLKYKLLAPEE